MLRYYDELGILKPKKVDSITGYRMYSAEQISILTKILYLRDCGFNVSEIGNILNENDESLIVKYINNKYQEIEQNILKEKEKLRKLKLAKKEILLNNDKTHFKTLIKSIPSYNVLSIRKTVPSYFDETLLWKELFHLISKNKLKFKEKSFSIYHDLEYKDRNVDIEVCAIIKDNVKPIENFAYRETPPIDNMACTLAYGDFSNISKVYENFAMWLEKNPNYEMVGQSRQIVHRGPHNEKNSSKYVIEIQVPLQLKN